MKSRHLLQFFIFRRLNYGSLFCVSRAVRYTVYGDERNVLLIGDGESVFDDSAVFINF